MAYKSIQSELKDPNETAKGYQYGQDIYRSGT